MPVFSISPRGRPGFLIALCITILPVSQLAAGWLEPIMLDTAYVPVPQDSVAEDPAIASDGAGFFAVWTDHRNGNPDIYGTRLSPDGHAIDFRGIPICTAAGDQEAPDVASYGGQYIVVWQDGRSGGHRAIYAARIDSSGRVLDSNGFAVTSTVRDRCNPGVTGARGHCFVVWDEFLRDRNIMGSLIDTSGAVSSAVAICTTAGTQALPAVSASDSGFMVVWQDSRSGPNSEIYFARLDTTGGLIDTNGIRLESDFYSQEAPTISSNGAEYLVVWQRTALLDADIYGIRLSSSGFPLDSAPLPIGCADGRQLQPSVTSGLSGYLVAWQDFRDTARAPDIYAARVLPNGGLPDPLGGAVSRTTDGQSRPAASSSDSSLAVVWEQRKPDSARVGIYCTAMSGPQAGDSLGVVVAARMIFRAQDAPALASCGRPCLAVWRDCRSGPSESDIYGIFLDSSGTTLSMGAFPISRAPGGQYSPATAFGDSVWLVVWEDRRAGYPEIFATRISHAGQVLDTGGLLISTQAFTGAVPRVAYDGANFVVVWKANNTQYVLGARVTPDGSVLDTMTVAFDSTRADAPAIASVDTVALIAWQAFQYNNAGIAGRRVGRSGSFLDSVPFAVSVGQRLDFYPALATDGEDFLAAWVRRQSGSWDIYAAMIAASGGTPNPQPIRLSNYQAEPPALAFNDQSYYVVWGSYENGINRLPGARLNRSGGLMDLFDVPVPSIGGHAPVLWSGSRGSVLASYYSIVDSIGPYLARTSRIWVTPAHFEVGVSGDLNCSGIMALNASPNPFTSQVRLVSGSARFRSGSRLTVFDASGRLVRSWSNLTTPGVVWDGTDSRNRSVPVGVYFVSVAGPEGEGAGAWVSLVKLR